MNYHAVEKVSVWPNWLLDMSKKKDRLKVLRCPICTGSKGKLYQTESSIEANLEGISLSRLDNSPLRHALDKPRRAGQLVN